MAGATLTALQLVCKVNRLDFDGGDLFVKCSMDHPAREHLKQADKAWRETVKQDEERRRRHLEVIKNRLSSKFSKNGGNGPSQNKDDDKDPASGGNGLSFLGPPFFAFCQAPLIFSLRPGPLPEMGPWAIKSFEQ